MQIFRKTTHFLLGFVYLGAALTVVGLESAQGQALDQIRRADGGSVDIVETPRTAIPIPRLAPRNRGEVIVDGIGRGKNRFRTISGALRAVREGGTITVLPRQGRKGDDLYKESLIIERSVRIVGSVQSGPGIDLTPRIQPEKGKPCATIRTRGTVELVNLDWIVPEADFQGTAPCLAAYSGSVTIKNNYVTGRSKAPAILIASQLSHVEGNEIAAAGTGIKLDIAPLERRRRTNVRRRHVIKSNLIYQAGDGISVLSREAYGLPAVPLDIDVTRNRILGAVGTGIGIFGVRDIHVSENVLERTGRDGIVVQGANGSFVSNRIMGCGRHGMVFDRSGYATKAEANAIRACAGYGIFLSNEPGGAFLHNKARDNEDCIGPRRTAKGLDIDLKDSCKY